MKKVMIVDDHPLFRSGTSDIISELGEYKIIAEFETGESAIDAIKQTAPDLLIIDISLPDISGFVVLEKSLEINPACNCIILTMHENKAFAKRALDMGAKGYLVKTDNKGTLRECFLTTEQGQSYVSPNVKDIEQSISNNTLEQSQSSIQNPSDTSYSSDEKLQQLSTRERTIMLLIAKGNTSKEISNQLHLSFRTVQNHRSNICNKLNIQGSNALLKFAIENEVILESIA
jgi:two-component system response regulator DegU